MKHDLTTGTWQDDTGCPISIILAATSDAWQLWDNGGYHGQPIRVFYLALGTLCVRYLPTPTPTNNQPPIHQTISINNRRMKTDSVTTLCTCIVDRRLCYMVAQFHYLAVNDAGLSSIC